MKCIKCQSERVVKKGWVKTRHRAKKVQRHHCKDCGVMFTSRNNLPTYRERRPDLNEKIKHMYVEGMPLRAIARVLGCSYNTVVRKFVKYAKVESESNDEAETLNPTKCKIIQIDEMVTFLNKRGNWVYIALAVAGHGKILSFQCGQDKKTTLHALMRDIETYVNDKTIFYSDKDMSYQKLLEQFYPQADYVILPRGEANEYLKHLNFVCALVRNRLGRMSRKSWCFTRDIGRLQLNLEMLMRRHNLAN